MRLTPEELEKYKKGVPVEHEEDNDSGLDKDDMLDREYPGVEGDEK